MGHFLIYVPGKRGTSNKTLEDLQLGGLIDNCGPEWREVDNGPDGKQGSLAIWRNRHNVSQQCSVHDKQDWRKFPGLPDGPKEGSWWFGLDAQDPLTPECLARSDKRRGRPVQMCDGQHWEVPISNYLPARWGLNYSTGERVRKFTPEFRKFFEASQRWMDMVLTALNAQQDLNKARIELDWGDLYEFCVTALSLNYRLTPVIVDFLELLDEQTMVQIIFAVSECDEEFRARVWGDDEKKKQTIIVAGART